MPAAQRGKDEGTGGVNVTRSENVSIRESLLLQIYTHFENEKRDLWPDKAVLPLPIKPLKDTKPVEE